MNRFASLAVILCAAPLAACAATQDRLASAPPPGHAKNVILFVGDGMGVSTVTAARIYEGQKRGEPGEENLLSFEKFPQTALVKTYNTNAQVPDSAGTATALNTGVKTRMGVIGVGPEAREGVCTDGLAHPLRSTAEDAHAAGLAVGIVTTTRITHATPAAVFGHSAHRDWESDSDIFAGQRGQGCTDLAAQLVAFPFEVALGGGAQKFFGKAGGGDRLDAAADLVRPWQQRSGGTYVTTAAALAAAPQGKPLLGLFTPSHMSYMLDRKAGTSEPTLTEMTAAALDHLGQARKGYYLMVEGGKIDHGHHEGKAGYALEEAVEFAKAVQYAVDHTDPRSTLILVTADHSHVFTISGYPKRGNPILGLVVGNDEHGDPQDKPTLAADGKPYTTLGYANGPGAVKGERPVPETGPRARQQSLVPNGSEAHAGEDVPLYATGPGSAGVHGVIEQNRVHDIVEDALGLRRPPE